MFVQHSIAKFFFLGHLQIRTVLAYHPCEEDRPEQDIWIQTL